MNQFCFQLFLYLLLLAVLALVRPGQSTDAIYYVIPADQPPDCLGYPCMLLDEYMGQPERYFSKDKVNVTMYFAPGVYTTKYENTVIRDLHTFEMAGKGRADDIVVCFSVVFNDVSNLRIESLTLSVAGGCTVSKMALVRVGIVIIKSVVGGVGGKATERSKVTSFKNTTDLDTECTIVPLNHEIGVSGQSCSVFITAYSNITVTNGTNFANLIYTPITTYESVVTLSGNITFVNNTGTKGGAIALYSSTLNIARNTSVDFFNNSAREVGGAIYVAMTTNPYDTRCFYQLLNYDNSSKEYSLRFEKNKAGKGGDHIYGANMQSICSVAYYKTSPTSGWIGEMISSYEAVNNYFTFVTDNSISSISSDPRGICLCDVSGRPRCANSISDIYQDCSVSPGQTVTLSVVVIGGSFGTTTGTVYADFLPLNSSNSHYVPSLEPKYQYAQWITNYKECFELEYTIYSHNTTEPIILYLTSTSESQPTVRERLGRRDKLKSDIAAYKSSGVIYESLLTTPIFLNITLLPCPKGFSLSGEPPRCNCYVYPGLPQYDINCSVVGTISWSGSLWIGAEDDGTLDVNYGCPVDYCKQGFKTVNFENNDTSDMCAFNHAGRLCGGCRSGYSLAIGSSHCIHCPNNNNLALLIFFAAAGLLLVFFISALNLTVTQGTINGLIFYANIVWAYQGVLFHDQTKQTNPVVLFEKTFIAWLNLDFGIETCFVDGLTAFWKMWLQYVFPVYTAGLFVVGLRYSTKLSKLFGGRSVPTLATLLFLSYTKLLRTIITSLELTHLTNFPSNTSRYVWSVDGRHDYGKFPHILLLLAAIACLILWSPYTLLLLLMQWLRRTSLYSVSKWVTKYKPVTDAYYAPLKDKHQYWFGVLLLTRGILLIISSLTASINPAVSLFLLFVVATLLLCYMNYMQVYKKNSVLILESAFLINLVLLTGGTMYYRNSEGNEQEIIIYLSIGIAFVKFCGITFWSIYQVFPRCRRKSTLISYATNDSENTNTSHRDSEFKESGKFRDSILDDAPLIYKPTKHPTY